MTATTVHIGCGAGFAGDRWDAAVPVVATLARRSGPRYLMYETLAERTLALAQQARIENPAAGYSPYLERILRPVLKTVKAAGIRVVSNFGAANPIGGARKILEMAREDGIAGLKVAVVEGDDLTAVMTEGDIRGHAPVEGLLINRTLLKEDSPYCWGRSCVQRGVGCHAYAQDFMFDRIITLKQAEESGEHFDIVGTFVTLDHTPDPIAMMKRLLKIGTRVLLEMHPPGWTDVQHFYALGDGFTKSFEQAGIHLRDLTTWSRAHGVPGPSNGSRFYILSVDDDLSWVPESPQA